MAGIVSCAAYIPFNRLSRDELGRAWGKPSLGGEKAVVNFDEDSLTMAVAAASEALRGVDKSKVGSLFFATTTSPYKEKQAAAIIAAALDLPSSVRTQDITGSLRSGTTALGLALDSVKSGSVELALVVASDCRLGTPQSDFEAWFGDGAAALVVGNSGVIAAVEGDRSVRSEFLDQWRGEGDFLHDSDLLLRSWEDRPALLAGYTASMREAVSALLKEKGVSPKDLSRVVVSAPTARSHSELVRALGFDPKTQVQETLLESVGNTGAAQALVMLASALERAKAGDRLLLANYGDGADAFLLKVTEEIGKRQVGKGVGKLLATKKMLSSYEKYLAFRNLVPVEPARLPGPPAPSAMVLWRRRKEILGLYGGKCRACGTTQYPPQRVCVQCQAKDQFDDYKFADKQGQLFTFCLDYVTSPSPDPPTAYCWVDFEGGARIVSPMTDFTPEEIKVGMTIEMTFRRFQQKDGISNYFWKCRPVRS
ncbi:MAG: 3-oxoacyl-[acyl-carrier-protein] synthase III C-terminal domain-containing protein [Dehalococcoidia bacterium]|nr:3-oxoacyl-[acyl-carrier-protein] synthase III C-terminal domain-containing protein [Dehalococcoidia bacterium]